MDESFMDLLPRSSSGYCFYGWFKVGVRILKVTGQSQRNRVSDHPQRMKPQLEDYYDDIFNELDLVRMRKFDPNPNSASYIDQFLDQITCHNDCPEASTVGSLQHSSRF
ncbi:hypothetical protein Hanom_Chr11g01000211 [Helianthus anomalus]